MSSNLKELNIEMGRQRAMNLIFDEYQTIPERDLELIDFKEVGRNWVATYKSPDLPDLLAIVEYYEQSKQTQTHIYERRTRASASAKEPALFEI